MLENIRSVDEAKFLIEKLCNSSITQACEMGISQSRLKEKEALLTEVQQDSTIQQTLLQHVLARNPAIALSEVSNHSFNSINSVNGNNSQDARITLENVAQSLKSGLSSRSPSPNNSEMSVLLNHYFNAFCVIHLI